jgi:hypothetical protein
LTRGVLICDSKVIEEGENLNGKCLVYFEESDIVNGEVAPLLTPLLLTELGHIP